MADLLKIYTLGNFTVKLGNHVITQKDNFNDKPWILFKYLISFPDKRVHPEILMETLWPEQNFSDPTHALRNLIYRLRKLLNSHEYIKSSKKGYSFNLQSNYWLDAEKFTSLCTKAGQVSKENKGKAIKIYKNALNLFKGDYLCENPYYHWLIPIRNNYHWLYIENTLNLISLLEQHGHNSQIIELCKNTFIIEPLEEKIHYNYMKALLREGKNAQARNHYKYVSSLFDKELGIDLSPEIENLFKNTKKDKQINNGIINIKEELKKKDREKGAFYCNSDIFRMLYKIEKRNSERGKGPGTIISFTINHKIDIEKKMKKTADLLKKNLRKGDLITRWEHNQYLILLKDSSLKEAEIIINRIKTHLSDEDNFNKKWLESEYQPL